MYIKTKKDLCKKLKKKNPLNEEKHFKKKNIRMETQKKNNEKKIGKMMEKTSK